MANWFKIFEVDLDESRMRFALGKLPEVWPVWTGLLMECCKHRNDTIKWGNGEQELFGFSDRLKITIPKVNHAITILAEIEYIQKLEGHLKVLKWSEKQDDYLSRKSRGYWENRRETKKVTVNHSESHIEERRGEEIRREESTGRSAPKPPQKSDEEWLQELQASVAYKALDVRAEFSKMQIWCQANHCQPTRRRFVNWLGRSKPMNVRTQSQQPPIYLNGNL